MEIFLVSTAVFCITFWWFGFKRPELIKKKQYDEIKRKEQERWANIARLEKEQAEKRKAQQEQEARTSQLRIEKLHAERVAKLGEKNRAHKREEEAKKSAKSLLIQQQVDETKKKQQHEAAEIKQKQEIQAAEEISKQKEADEVKKRLAHDQWLEQNTKYKRDLELKEEQANKKRKSERENAERKAKKSIELAEAKVQAKLLEQKAVEAEKKKEAAKEKRREADRLNRAKLKATAEKKKQSKQVDWHTPSALTLCEENTSYCNLLNTRFNLRQQNFSFDDIRSLSSAQGDHVFYQLQSGIKQLDSPEQLSQYIFSYGKMHKAKLYEAFSTFVNKNVLNIEGKQIEVFDYGCGQGIATVLLIDYLKACNNLGFRMAQVVLIEPSVLALKRAALHVRYTLRAC